MKNCASSYATKYIVISKTVQRRLRRQSLLQCVYFHMEDYCFECYLFLRSNWKLLVSWTMKWRIVHRHMRQCTSSNQNGTSSIGKTESWFSKLDKCFYCIWKTIPNWAAHIFFSFSSFLKNFTGLNWSICIELSEKYFSDRWQYTFVYMVKVLLTEFVEIFTIWINRKIL